ncbi:MAG: hypothetical protein MZV63_70590 [Marinilabiliales bacterium]|nr:hypothetical protein [Marinilabiliales bacterium]
MRRRNSREYPALSLEKKRDYVSHFTPHRTGDGRIVSLKTSLVRLRHSSS